MEVAGGVGEVLLGAGLAGATWETGIGFYAGMALAAHGIDTTIKGCSQILTNEEKTSLTVTAMQFAGMPEQIAKNVDTILGVGGTIGVARKLVAESVETAIKIAGTQAKGSVPAGSVAETCPRVIGLAESSSIKINHNLIIKNFDGILSDFQRCNFEKWNAQEVILAPGKTLYRVHTPNLQAGSWWTRSKPQSEIQFRIDYAVKNEWNDASMISIMKIPEGYGLKAWEGFSASQGGILAGGKNQLYIPNVPEGWILTDKSGFKK